MNRRTFSALALALLLALGQSAAFAASDDKDADTDTRLVGARLVEVCETRISVMTRGNIEHVIAVDGARTKVRIGERVVAVKELQTGDVVTVELEEENPVKFARDIQASPRAAEQAARKP